MQIVWRRTLLKRCQNLKLNLNSQTMQRVGYGNNDDDNIDIVDGIALRRLALAMGNRCCPLSTAPTPCPAIYLPCKCRSRTFPPSSWIGILATLAKIAPAPRPPKVCQCWHPGGTTLSSTDPAIRRSQPKRIPRRTAS